MSERLPRERCITPRTLAAIAAAPICFGFLATSAGAAPVQCGGQRTTPPPLTTSADTPKDRDGDGLDNSLEAGQASAFDRVDTDYDGWNDAEELARGSLANAPVSLPHDAPVSVGARAYMRADKLHVAIASYIRCGTLENAHLDIGIYAYGRMVPLSPMSYGQHASITTVPTKDPGELLIVTDIIVPNAALVRSGKMSIYAILRVGDLQRAADAINLEMQGGIPVALIDPAQFSPNAAEQLGPGLLHRPLGGTTPPIQWSAGEICFQRMESVGTHGAVVTQEVTSAACVSGWDGYCDGGTCSSSVGSTVDVVDPGALVGG